MFVQFIWIAGFALMLVWLAYIAARIRSRHEFTLSRATVIAAAGLVATLGFGSAYVWGIDVARRGMDKIVATPQAASTDPSAAAPARSTPARARLFLRYAQILLMPTDAGGDANPGAGYLASVGYSPEAALRLPRSYGLEEAKQAWDLIRVGAAGPQGLSVQPITHSEASRTRLFIRSHRRPISAEPSPARTERIARGLLDRSRGCPDPGGDGDGAGVLDGPGSIYAIVCIGARPRAALVFERDLAAPRGDGVAAAHVPVRVTPLVWRGNRFRHHHVQIASGSLIQIGTMDDALPGVTLWEVPAPSGRAELFFPPRDLLAPCSEWLSGKRDEGFFSNRAADAGSTGRDADELAVRPPVPDDDGDSSICVLPFTPPFGLEVRRLLPDLPGVATRSLWAAALMTTPALLLLLLLCARSRGELSARRFHRLTTLGWIASLLSAVAVNRLLWAHRIDMLRDYQSVGQRVLQNQVLLVLVGAALAATCVLVWPDGRRRLRVMWIGCLAWALWLVIGGYALLGDIAGIDTGGRLVIQLVVSFGLGTVIGWIPYARRRLGPATRTWLERLAARLRVGGQPWDGIPWLAAAVGLAAATAVATALGIWFPRLVAGKLVLAWSLVLLVYAALRTSITPGGIALTRVFVAFALTAAAVAALFALDPGVTVAITLPGLVVALVFASHDARFGDASLRQIASYRRHHAPLILAHAALLAALGAVTVVWAGSGLWASADGEPDAMLARSLTSATIHLALYAAALFLPAAAIAYVRRGLRAAAPWLVCAALFAGLWALRAPLVDTVLGSRAQAANRIAIVLDPGYALLRDENKFLAGITAWRETIALPHDLGDDEPARAPALGDGQGYFGAQLIDPGVLLSVENDYFPVLLLREAGVRGVMAHTLLLLVAVAGLWLLSGSRFRHGSAAQRARAVIAAVLGVVCVYQPLASLGTLPLTGIAWPGFGLDSPSDFWLVFMLLLWVLVWGERDPTRDAGDDGGDQVDRRADRRADRRIDEFDSELRGSRLFRRVRAAVAVTAGVAILAALLLLGRAAAFALQRPNPVDLQGRAVKPFDDLEHAVDYAYRLQCPWRAKSVPVGPDAAEALVPTDVLGDALGDGIARFHAAMRASWQAHRQRAVAALRPFLAGQVECHSIPRAGPWRFAPNPEDADECQATFKVGWPEVELLVARGSGVPGDPTGDPTESRSPGEDVAGDPDPDADRDPDRELDDDPEPDDPGSDESKQSDDANDFGHRARCRIEVRTEVLRKLRFPARRPYRNARIRLMSRAMGAAARDRGELVSGHLIVRLRPGAGPADVSRARAGLYFGDEVRISSDLTVAVEQGKAVLRRQVATADAANDGSPVVSGSPADRTSGAARPVDRTAGPPHSSDRTAGPPGSSNPVGKPATDDPSWLFTRDPPPHNIQVLEASDGTWTLLPPDAERVELTKLTLLVVGRADARSLWLFRPPTEWPEEPAAVHSLIADDVSTVLGERRRHYLFGGLIPEIGWVNRYHQRMSLGLDGWVRVAMTEYETAEPRRSAWRDDGEEVPYCGTLEPIDGTIRPGGSIDSSPVASADGRHRSAGLEPTVGRVCARSALDGVLECRVSVQPELAIRLRHLTELVSAQPGEFAGKGNAAPIRADFVLLRGDTGEIVAQGEYVPGRASSAYAPATPEIEQYLIRLREDRDPRTGDRLPAEARGEASAEKVEWSQPIAVGSTMKPLLARALEHADPALARGLVLDGRPLDLATTRCRGSRVPAIFGHCPPTKSLWNLPGRTDMARFLATSVNWYQASIGLLGTAAGRGSLGFGREREATDPAAAEFVAQTDPLALAGQNPGAHAIDSALWTRYKGTEVISANRRINVKTLRRTAMWRNFEKLLGRPLCTAGNKARCTRRGDRRDLCAARALPIEQPTRDLRHLVALGPGTFDFYPRLSDPTRRVGPRVNTREYLQFLRGSGLHPLGSLAQLTDAFNRVIYQHDHDPESAGGYQLAASWFPVAPAGTVPDWDCSAPATGNDVKSGLCQVVRSGTASRVLGNLPADPGLVIYGAKTGTIDSLADVAENKDACEHFRTGHTVPDRPDRDSDQPYWLPCDERRTPAEVNDSLLVISFAVRTGQPVQADGTPAPTGTTTDGVVPLTLGLRFQRGGPGFATVVARHYLDVIRAYFAP